MTNKSKITFLVIALIAPLALMAQNSDFTIKGKVGTWNAPAKVYLSYRLAATSVLDSTSISNGVFEFKGSISDPVLASVMINYMGTGLRSRSLQRLPLYLESGAIEIESADSLGKAMVKGGEVNKAYSALQFALKPSQNKYDVFMAEYLAMPKEKQSDSTIRAGLDIRYKAIEAEKTAAYNKYIKSHPNSIISVYALTQFGGSIPDYEVVSPLYNSLSDGVKNSTSGKAYAQKLEIMKLTIIGAIPPDFTQNDPDGKPISLSNFRGKYLLIDFWASWCAPCRAENPNVVKAYAKYHEKGFEILGVSLDNEKGRDNWLNAIKKDGLAWTQVSDLKYWNNEVARKYGISSIPQNFLLDPTGKIVGKNLRGEALSKKLEEIFNK
ncbi:MAG: TlpA disulfide reductase family protein [Prolixibacteraceae bacterium]